MTLVPVDQGKSWAFIAISSLPSLVSTSAYMLALCYALHFIMNYSSSFSSLYLLMAKCGPIDKMQYLTSHRHSYVDDK